MDIQANLELIKTIAVILFGGIALYLKFSTKAQTKAKIIQETIAEITAKAVIFIKEAEEEYKDTTKAGGAKFEQVVNKLHNLIPAGLQGIITREMIENIVQKTFDEIEEYVKIQLDKAVEKIDVK